MSKIEVVMMPRGAGKSLAQTFNKSLYDMLKQESLMNPKWWRYADYMRIVVNSNEQAQLTWVGDISTAPQGLPFNTICDYRRLPKWLKDKVLKLSIMEYPHPPIPKIGRRVGNHTYLVLPPPTTKGPKKRDKYGTSSR